VLVGNDVVALGSAEAAASAARAGYAERVCSPAELVRLRAAPRPAVLLGQLFAAKEAAYKVVVKLAPDTLLAHRSFEVSDDLSEVRHGELRLSLWVDTTPERVHAVVTTGGPADLSGVGTLADGEPQSGAARRALVRAAAARLGWPVEELSVVRPTRPGGWDGYGPPALLRNGAPLDMDVSLSLDERFVAFAAAGRTFVQR
jgi:phosphopantetheinyl transferase (holo-ACP synthase)